MFSLSAFFALFFQRGIRGYPIAAYSHVRTPFQAKRRLTPVAFVVVSTGQGNGCRRITYSQGEFAARFCL